MTGMQYASNAAQRLRLLRGTIVAEFELYAAVENAMDEDYSEEYPVGRVSVRLHEDATFAIECAYNNWHGVYGDIPVHDVPGRVADLLDELGLRLERERGVRLAIGGGREALEGFSATRLQERAGELLQLRHVAQTVGITVDDLGPRTAAVGSAPPRSATQPVVGF